MKQQIAAKAVENNEVNFIIARLERSVRELLSNHPAGAHRAEVERHANQVLMDLNRWRGLQNAAPGSLSAR